MPSSKHLKPPFWFCRIFIITNHLKVQSTISSTSRATAYGACAVKTLNMKWLLWKLLIWWSFLQIWIWDFTTVRKPLCCKKSASLGQYCTTLHTNLFIFPMQSSSPFRIYFPFTFSRLCWYRFINYLFSGLHREAEAGLINEKGCITYLYYFLTFLCDFWKYFYIILSMYVISFLFSFVKKRNSSNSVMFVVSTLRHIRPVQFLHHIWPAAW